jgi:hypothetical protein
MEKLIRAGTMEERRHAQRSGVTGRKRWLSSFSRANRRAVRLCANQQTVDRKRAVQLLPHSARCRSNAARRIESKFPFHCSNLRFQRSRRWFVPTRGRFCPCRCRPQPQLVNNVDESPHESFAAKLEELFRTTKTRRSTRGLNHRTNVWHWLESIVGGTWIGSFRSRSDWPEALPNTR